MATILPLANRVLLKPDEAKKMYGVLHLPDSAQQAFCMGTVIEVGEGVIRHDGTMHPMSVKPGYRVMYSPFTTGTKIKIKGEEFLILEERDLMAIVIGETE